MGVPSDDPKKSHMVWATYSFDSKALAILRFGALFGMVSSRDLNSKVVGDLQLADQKVILNQPAKKTLENYRFGRDLFFFVRGAER